MGDNLNPFYTLPRRQRTGRTPPPPISPLGSPPEKTPGPARPISPLSPQKYPVYPVFNVRKVDTPPKYPDVILSPFYGHSTPDPGVTHPSHQPAPGDWLDERHARWGRWRQRRETLDRMEWLQRSLFSSPVARRDADSLFEDDFLVPFIEKTPTPPRPQAPYPRAQTPSRSPAVELMREEMKKDEELSKYSNWHRNNKHQAALRDIIMKGILKTLKGCFPGVDLEKMNVYQTIALLSEYLKDITEKLLTQNLELPPLASNNPALSILEQKKISIRRIIGEYKNQYLKVAHKLDLVKGSIRIYKGDEQSKERMMRFREKDKKEIETLKQGEEKRMERITAKIGVCMVSCENRKNRDRWQVENRPLEQELDDIMRRIVEMETACMEAMADMTQFADFVSSNFLKNIAAFIRKLFPSYRNWVIPPEAYEEAAKDVSKHLRRIFRQKRQEWVEVNREVMGLYPMIKEKREEKDELMTTVDNCKKEILKLRAEFNNYKTHSLNTEWMIKAARTMLSGYEHEYASTYQALKREKRKTVKFEAELGMSPRGPPELAPEREQPKTSSPIITHPQSPTSIPSPPGEIIGSPTYASSPQQETSSAYDSLDRERPPSAMLDISYRSGSGGSVGPDRTLQAPFESDNLEDERPPSAMLDFSGLQGGASFLEDERPPSAMLDFSGLQGGASFLESPGKDASSIKKTVSIPSTGKREQLQIDVEIIPQDIRRSPSGQRVVCDVALELQEATVKPPRPPRRIERRYHVVRGAPPISQTVGRRVDRRYGMFTPQSVIRRGHVGVRRPLFAGDFESPDSPWGTGRRTHPELMNLSRAPSPRPPRLDTTMEWENPELNVGFRE